MKSKGKARPDLDAVNDLAISLLKRNTLDDILWDIADAIGRLPGFEDSVVYLLQDDLLVQKAAYGLKQLAGRVILEPLEIPLGSGIVGTVAKTGISEIVNDTSRDPRYIQDQFGGRSELSVPVIFEDRVIAVLDSENERKNAYNEQHLATMRTMANISASRIASAIAEEEKSRMQADLAELNRELESRVEARTLQLREVNQVLQAQHGRLESILNSLQDGLICVDENLCVALLSPSAERTIGWTAQDALGENLAKIFRLSEVESLESAITEAIYAIVPLESQLEVREGDCLDIRWSVNVSENFQGERQYVIVFSDITEQKALTKQVERVHRMESLGVLAGGIAHDFNNNLAAIQSAVESLRTANDASQADALELAGIACKSAKSLSQQLMTYAKGGVPIRKPENLNEIITSAVSLATSGCRTVVQWQLSEKDTYVQVDEGQLTQVFSNVILNAVQAQDGAGRIEISTHFPEGMAGPNVEIVIRDFGPGIPEEKIESIFEPYFTLKEHGNGLGLTTSYFITKDHGGNLSIRNWGNGAEVRVTVPQIAATGASRLQLQKAAMDSAALVLVMDDQDMVRHGISMLVKSLGHEVLEAANGEEALELLKTARENSRSVQIALLDLTVRGGLGGVEVLPDLKRVQPSMKCVACSGYGENAIMGRFEEYGFDGVQPKPFSRDELARNLDLHLTALP